MAELVRVATAAEVAKHAADRDDNYVWNYAYGANMNPVSLTKRRKIHPVCSIGGVLPGWELRFNCRGIPAVEPAFANVQPSTTPDAQVHGVLHRMTKAEFEQLMQTEGGGGYKDLPGYKAVEVEVTAYTGEKIKAFALSMSRTSEGLLPSNRYLTLLRNGAAWHQLHPKYCEYLNAHAANRSGWLQRGYLLANAIILLPVLLICLGALLFARRSYFSHLMNHYLMNCVHFLHCSSCRTDSNSGVPNVFTMAERMPYAYYDPAVAAAKAGAGARDNMKTA